MKEKLSKSMTVEQFVNGYWYAVEIKAFAKEIGISPVTGLRKDELETLIIGFLKTGMIPKPKRARRREMRVKDSDNGLRLSLPIVRYTNNPETKDFLWTEAKKIDPELKQKSGAMYRLNRWREEQIASGNKISYGDLVNQYVALCRTKGSFPQAPSGRYINFVANFLKGEKNPTRENAQKAWAELKEMPIRKNYAAWKKHKAGR